MTINNEIELARKKRRALRERIRRKMMKEKDPDYYRKIYLKYQDKNRMRANLNYRKNKDRILKRMKLSYDPIKKSQYNKKYRLKNYKKLNKNNYNYQKERIKTDPFYRLIRNLRDRTRKACNSKKYRKDISYCKYIGCGSKQLREYLENKFKDGMNWNNYGSKLNNWSIDHIIPVCNFDLTDENEKLKCWNWSNLMPVTIKFNSSKKDIDINQINYILKQLENFKEEGSTTKWFSEEFILNAASYEKYDNKDKINILKI